VAPPDERFLKAAMGFMDGGGSPLREAFHRAYPYQPTYESKTRSNRTMMKTSQPFMVAIHGDFATLEGLVVVACGCALVVV
jgi:hypothetical protein